MLLVRGLKLCSHVLRSNSVLYKAQSAPTCRFYYHMLTRPKLTSKCNNNQRQFFNWFQKPSETQLKQRDRIAPEYKLIYNTTLDRYLVIGQIVTVAISSILGFIFIFKGDITAPMMRLEKEKIVDNEMYLYVTVLVICIFVIQRVISKVPVRIYKSPQSKQYVFVIRGLAPFTRKYLTCRSNGLRKVEDISSIIPWKNDTYTLMKGNEEKTVVLMDYYFKRPADLNILLGYQKEDE